MKNDDKKNSQSDSQSIPHKKSETKKATDLEKTTNAAKEKQKQLDKIKALDKQADKLKAKEFREQKSEQRQENSDLVADKSAVFLAENQKSPTDDEQVAAVGANTEQPIAASVAESPAEMAQDKIADARETVTTATDVESNGNEIAQQGQRTGKGGGVTTPAGITFDLTEGIKEGFLTTGTVAGMHAVAQAAAHAVTTPATSPGNLSGQISIPDHTVPATSAQIPTAIPGKEPTVTPDQTPTAVPGQVPTTMNVPDKVPQPTPDQIPTAVPGQVPTAMNVPDKVPQPTPDQIPTAVPGQVPTAMNVPDKVPQPTPNQIPTAVPGQVPTAMNVPDKVPYPTPNQIPTAVPGQVPTAMNMPDKVPHPTPNQVPTATPHLALTASVSVDAVTKDNIVNAVESQGSVAITGSVGGDVKDGDIVSLMINNHGYLAKVVAGAFTVDVAGTDLTAGHNVHAEVIATNAFGESKQATDEHGYQVDTDSFLTVNMHGDTDSGVSGDFITNNSNPSLLGFAEPNAQITVTDQQGNTVGQGIANTMLGKNWGVYERLTLTGLGEGKHDLIITATDAAGNSTTVNQTITIDSQVGAPDSITFENPGVDKVYNQAELGTDGKVNAIIFLPNDVKVGDKINVNGATHSLTAENIKHAAFALQVTPGTEIKASITDTAGNTSIEVKANAPDADVKAPVVTITDVALTNDNTPDITGTVDDHSANVVVTIGTHDYTATNNGDGTWTLLGTAISAPLLDDLSTPLVVKATDSAGNVGANIGLAAIDTKAPAVSVNNVTLTNDNTPNITGTIDDHNASIVIRIGINDYPATNHGDGTWTLLGSDISAPLPDGLSMPIVIKATDAAGNVGANIGLASIDTTIDATDDKNTAVEDQGTTATQGNVLTNDDHDGTQVTVENIAGKYGTFHFKSDGSYTYELDNSKVQSFAQGEQHNDSASYTVTDAAGNSTTAELKIEITGTADKAVISGTEIGDVNEDADGDLSAYGAGAGGFGYDLTTKGKLTISDADTGQDYFPQGHGSATWYHGDHGGQLIISKDGHWTYDIYNAAQKVQELGQGETFIDTVTVHSADGTEHQIKVTVHGTNDVPTIQAQTQAVSEGGALLQGQMQASDVDKNDQLSFSLTKQVDGLTLSSDGSYSFNPKDVSYDYLAGGQQLTLTIPVTVTDSSNATSTNNLLINIAGTNDSALITGPSTADLTEDLNPSGNYLYSSGQLASSDIDNPDNQFTKASLATDINGQATIGHLNIGPHGLWTYHIDNTKIQNLNDGDSLVERFIVHSVDGSSHEIVATVHGQTDVPAAIVMNVPNLAPMTTPNATPTAVPHQVPIAQVAQVPASAVITLDDITPDNVINAVESSQKVHVTGTVGGDVKDGDVVTLTVNQQIFTGHANGGIFDVLVDGSDLVTDNKIQAEVVGTSSTGDHTTATTEQAYLVDTTAPLLVFRASNITQDNIINAQEAGKTIDVDGNVAGTDYVGGEIELTVNGKIFRGTVPSNGHFTIAIPGSDLAADSNNQISGKVTSVDNAGNVGSATATYHYGVDTAAPLLVLKASNITQDNIINAQEAGKTIDVDGNVAGTDYVGGEVELTVNGKIFRGTVPSNGHFTIAIPGSDLVADSNNQISGKVTSVDNAGNVGSATATYNYGVDTTAPTLVFRASSITQDNIINAQEAGTSIDVEGNVAGTDYVGGEIELTVNGKIFRGTVPANGHFTIAIPGSDLVADSNNQISGKVTSVDNAGNVGSASAVYNYGVDTKALISMDPISRENILEVSEQQQNLEISGHVTGVEDGQVVTISIAGQTYNANVQHGVWSTSLTPAQVQAMSGGINDVSASVSDLAGNIVDTKSPLFVADALNQPPSLSFKTPPVLTGGGHLNTHVSGDLIVPPLLQQLNPQQTTGGWAISDGHGHSVTSLRGHYGTLTIDPDSGHVEYLYNHAPSIGAKAAGGSHWAGQKISEEHHDLFQVLYHDSHASNVDVTVNLDVTYIHGHSGQNQMTTQLVGMGVSSANPQPAPPPPPLFDDILEDTMSQEHEAVPVSEFEHQSDQAGLSSPVDHYLNILGINKGETAASEQPVLEADLLAPITTSSTDGGVDPLVDDVKVDPFTSPLDDEKHHQDFSTLDDNQDGQGLAEPLIENDDGSLHQALNDMHSQI